MDMNLSIVLASMLAAVAANGSTNLPSDPAKQMICKYEAKTGTRFAKKICRTAAEWEEITEQHRRDAKEMIDRPQIETRKE